jgi:hypothetical protein
MGANAVLMMRFDFAEIGQTMSEIVGYGTAAVIEREPVRAGRCVVPGPSAPINCGTWRCCRSVSRSAVDVRHSPVG